MSKIYDYLIVGSGLFGSILARELTDAGATCLVVEKRKHIGGNCYDKNYDGIYVSQYGGHIFHTNSKKIWDYMHRWTEFNNYVNRVKTWSDGKLYSLPINLFTMYQLWGISSPDEAVKKLNSVKIQIKNPSNLEEWALTEIGEELYYKFIYGYTKKQWGKEPKDLPSFIIKRLPIRLTMDDNYFNDRYQGMPVLGYTEIFNKLLKNIAVETEVDYLNDREFLEKKAKKIIYTGPIDSFFNYEHGTLEWRSLTFDHQVLNISDYQGFASCNFSDYSIPQTRIIEHKHFYFGKQPFTVITKEYPAQWDVSKEKYYPVNDEKNNILYNKYKQQIDDARYIFGGRLADYKYYDMHQIVGSALMHSEKEIKNF
jgi:UDP-galactopyranose mutase